MASVASGHKNKASGAMNWRIILTLIIIGAVCWATAYLLQPDPFQSSRNNFEGARPQAYVPHVPSTYVPGGSTCGTEELAELGFGPRADALRQECAEAAEAHRLQTNDLIQQTRAADAAEFQAKVSFRTSWIMLLQTIGAFLTLCAAAAAAIYARAAAREAKRSADIATQEVGLVATIHEAENRPWLLIDEVRLTSARVEQVYSGEQKFLVCTWQVTLVNSGKIPVLSCILQHGLVRTEGVHDVDIEYAADNSAINEQFVDVIAPGTRRTVEIHGMCKTSMEDRHLYLHFLFLRAKYRSAAGSRTFSTKQIRRHPPEILERAFNLDEHQTKFEAPIDLMLNDAHTMAID